MSAIGKAVPVVLREKRGQQEILAFRHPKAGLQIVKGTIEAGETPEAAAARELAEESGLTDATLVRPLGVSSEIVSDEAWHFFLFVAPEQPARWVYMAPDDDGTIFSFFWHPVNEEPGENWHPIFRRALAYVRATTDGAG